MLMVDYILEISEEKVVTNFLIKEENPFVEEDHFSEPGLIENAAQTCSAIVGQSFFGDGKENVKLIGFITNIKKVSIFEVPKVGEQILTKAELVAKFGNICTMKCSTFCGERLLSEAEINLFIKETNA